MSYSFECVRFFQLQSAEEPTCLKAAWELMEMFYADKTCLSWWPERLVDWLSVISFFLH